MNDFATLYHAHHLRHQEDLPFWFELARQANGSILELGCGTGRVFLPLLKAGFPVYGLDNDVDMLAYLRQNLAEVEFQQRIFFSDMTQMILPLQFALIILPCNTLSTLNATQRQVTFAQVHAHLVARGTFAASLPNPEVLRSAPARGAAEVEEVFEHPVSGNPVQVSSAWRRGADSFSLTWHYDHLFPDGNVQRQSKRTRHFLVPAGVYQYELDSAGLANPALFGDFDLSPYAPDSPYLILTAKREE
jgi:SAM-dependent methyltransferase